MATKTEQQYEAYSRLSLLTEKYDLNPNILKYFKEGKLYYSYLTAGGFMSSIDTIDYDPSYTEAVRSFEKHYGYLVYHAIEWETPMGKSLSLLYVGNNEDDWAVERLDEDYDMIFAYVVNLDMPDFSEFGSIKVTGIGNCLIRIG